MSTEEVHLAAFPLETESNPKRFDGPHSFNGRLLNFDENDRTDFHCETSRMSWQSQLIWWCDPRQWLRAILQLQDTPHSIALGTSLGVFIGLTPSFGIQMMLVLTLAFLTKPFFHFNRFAALVAVYVSNPFTMVPIYWFNYRIGAIFTDTRITWENFVELFQYSGYSEWWGTITTVFYTLGTPLIIGSLIVASFFALPTYPLILRLAERVQEHREAKLRQSTAHRESKTQVVTIGDSESSSIS